MDERPVYDDPGPGDAAEARLRRALDLLPPGFRGVVLGPRRPEPYEVLEGKVQPSQTTAAPNATATREIFVFMGWEV